MSIQNLKFFSKVVIFLILILKFEFLFFSTRCCQLFFPNFFSAHLSLTVLGSKGFKIKEKVNLPYPPPKKHFLKKSSIEICKSLFPKSILFHFNCNSRVLSRILFWKSMGQVYQCKRKIPKWVRLFSKTYFLCKWFREEKSISSKK